MKKLPQKIVVFGPSTVYGKNDSEGGFVARLRKLSEQENNNNIVFNLGISGESSRELLTRFLLEVPPRKPNLIILYPGLNDILRRGGKDSTRLVEEEETINNWTQILSSAQSLASVIVILPLSFDETRTTPLVANYYYFLDDAKIHLCDIHMLCQQLQILAVEVPFSSDNLDEFISTDGLHPNSKGHELILQKLLEVIL